MTQKTLENFQYQTFIIHYGEIALKKGNRSWFEDQLTKNILLAVAKIGPGSVRRLSGRLHLEFENPHSGKQVLEKLSKVFGVVKIAPAIHCQPDLSQIKLAAAKIADQKKFATFAVRTKRGEKNFPLKSQQVNEQVGGLILEKTQAKVNLDQPEFTLNIEILNKEAFVAGNYDFGRGGLPVGVSGKVACLISGGIDSPVAAWRIMKRGCLPVYVHFHSAPYTSDASQDKVLDMVKILMQAQPQTRLLVVPFGEIQQKVVLNVPPSWRIVIYRRLMVRIAEKIALREQALALVTGEALSQVASQTLTNLATINEVVNLPILRPLVGMDKQEIVDEAKKIGTFETAILPHDDCCSFLMPPNPVTRSTKFEADKVEQKLEIEQLVNLALDSVKVIDI
ncbi:MAG: tRNA uracil 4-sulfurtransferase ThiI [Pseudomonadota bacterium]